MVRVKKLNPQGLSVRQDRVVGNIVSAPGKVFLCLDVISAEPMITAMISNDPFYTYATYSGVGRKPFYSKGILMVPDLYLMYASVCPVTAPTIKSKFDPDEWMIDPDAVKKKLKTERSLCKVVVLSAGYGVGAEKLNQIFRENGFSVSKEDTKLALQAYWSLFAQIKKTATRLSKQYENEGYLVNLFGYRFAPPKAKDCFNQYAQSTVAGLMLYCIQLVFEKGKHLDQRFVTSIHDSLIIELPEENVEAAKKLIQEVAVEMNAELNWTIPIRFDINVDTNFYGLK